LRVEDRLANTRDKGPIKIDTEQSNW
jgi:hypothetical protein